MINPDNLKKLINAALSSEDFDFFCYDNFKDAHDQFTIGMTYPQKIEILVTLCTENHQLEELMAKIKVANPTKFAQLEQSLWA